MRRSKFLPDGAKIPVFILNTLAVRLRAVLDYAPGVSELIRSREAAEIWRRVYPDLSEGQPGLAGAVIARAESQVMRLACVYALLDQSMVIRPEYLYAALPVWDYCEASARFVFGMAQGDPVADRVLEALKAGPLTQTELYVYFGRHLSSKAIRDALQRLSAAGKVLHEETRTEGRPKIIWRLAH